MLGWGNLVVMLFNRHAHFGHDGEHLGTDVLAAIDGRDREVTTLDARAVTQVAFFEITGCIVWAFNAVNFVIAPVH